MHKGQQAPTGVSRTKPGEQDVISQIWGVHLETPAMQMQLVQPSSSFQTEPVCKQTKKHEKRKNVWWQKNSKTANKKK